MWHKIWRSNYPLWLTVLFALGIRLWGSTTPAQLYDIATFQAWGNHLLSVGVSHFFTNIWSDYLPLPILTFALPAYLAQITPLSFPFLFKAFHSLIEVWLLVLINRSLPLRSRWITLLLFFSPALIGDTSFWGQVDSLPSLLALYSLTLLRSNSVLSAVFYGLAVAYKPILILISPILWFLAGKRRFWWQFPLLAGTTFFVTAIPTGGLNFIPHLLSRIFEQIGTYPFMTINAWNLWSLLPVNSWIPDNTSILGISAHTAGTILFVVTLLVSLNSWRKHHFALVFAPRMCATILLLFFTFTTRMHERHLLFGLPFLALAISSQKFLVLPFTLYSAYFLFNLYGAFSWVNHAQTWPFSSAFISLISWLVVITSLSLAFIWDWSQFFRSLLVKIKTNQLLVGLLIFATCLRFFTLSHPPQYIFDEVYHAFTSQEYLQNHVEAWEWWTTPPEGVAYEWTHPPLAKYGMVLGMLLFGDQEFGYRFGSAVMGVLSILAVYQLVLALSFPRKTALTAAFLVTIEGLHLVQSRIAMNDIYLLTFLLWSLYSALKSRWKLSAVLFGLAFASKWSAVYGLLPLALIYLHQFKLSLKSALISLQLLLITILVYLLSFAPFLLAGHTYAQLLELHRQMWYYHTHLIATHAYQSTPAQWIFAARPVWYWVKYGQGVLANIYVQSNPLILWFGLAALIFQLKKIFRFPFLFLFVSYLVFVVPWQFSPRIMFFYHYLPSSVFLCILLAVWLSSLRQSYSRLILTLCFIGFLFLTPLFYGFSLPQNYWHTLFSLFPSWK
ncbi:MAG: Dolichyl-phosphate-mannose-protein mannosyltransferase family protein [Microgenomates group bacterium GW2011_GWC1_46_16]|uniref:Polyprenol-phosphate-mannose--protein mannosyltransferase n=1 Tax=Candidatus Collierbacteria bacterium RIFOXYD1_FULL_46_26 TaxID=1817732 RepID=A0A1F5FZP8_9BACT|nr:MAG: Dolichyl-phosphate-mannose-protein mannosyltransferase family protein [Microgenomates group bacterium GW2011_GWF1_46_12]KKU26945.1 MAG: Dolichyl-phosphate-mannose-protein mannosyltransferase family protein [Microgenomates group bacterium GW2011_GWC1_46_16]KKU27449.1 MAG: Dolichyl-phosphate-mannose-protein mannosyltransferase family protein [Microgenomates group bacterium GW2011_GWF2_46_18]KKU44017.1 MAG: Dolichyl-phosphate-mannose-protein mannosyltransferase family protein [Microgenomate